eukprot:s36_g6.t1
MADPDGSPPTPPGPPPARVTPPGSAGSGRSARSYLAPAAGIIRSSSQGSIVQEGAEPIPRAASTGALRRPSSAQRSATGTLPSITDPPPAPHPLTEKLDRSKVKVPPAPPTAGSTVKWVPHTHANPKHARFCFICLHGKLEGERDGIDEEVKRQKAEDGDLPNQVDMKEPLLFCGRCRRSSANEWALARKAVPVNDSQALPLLLVTTATQVCIAAEVEVPAHASGARGERDCGSTHG